MFSHKGKAFSTLFNKNYYFYTIFLFRFTCFCSFIFINNCGKELRMIKFLFSLLFPLSLDLSMHYLHWRLWKYLHIVSVNKPRWTHLDQLAMRPLLNRQSYIFFRFYVYVCSLRIIIALSCSYLLVSVPVLLLFFFLFLLLLFSSLLIFIVIHQFAQKKKIIFILFFCQCKVKINQRTLWFKMAHIKIVYLLCLFCYLHVRVKT